MDNFSGATLALAMIAALLLAAGGAKLALSRQTRGRILMIAAAAVLVTNVMIWTV